MDCIIPSSILGQALAVKAEEKRARMEARTAPVWVYVMCWQRRGPCKVGVAENVTHRRSELQIGNPYELAIFSGAGMPDAPTAFLIEGAMKRRFKGRALMGEWFEVTALEMTAGLHHIVRTRGIDLIEYGGPRTVQGVSRQRKSRDERSERARRAMAEYHKLNEL